MKDPVGITEWSRHLIIWSRNHEYSILSRKDLWSYYQSLGSNFRYVLGKVLGTQDRPTLRLASYHCVLYLNLIKSTFNTCTYTHTHTHTHTIIHLCIQHGIFHPKQNILVYLSQKKKRIQHIKETLAFIRHVRTYHTSKTKQPPKHGNKHIIIARKSYYKQGDTCVKGGLNKQHACSCECMTYFTYYAVS